MNLVTGVISCVVIGLDYGYAAGFAFRSGQQKGTLPIIPNCRWNVERKSDYGYGSSQRVKSVAVFMAVDDEDSDLFEESKKTAILEAELTEDEAELEMSAADKVILQEAKDELLALAKLTKRGFDATRMQKARARELADIMKKYNPTPEPASPFYPEDEASPEWAKGATLSGKWTLVYTDAPDIVTLDGGPLAASKLGRIGQECSPPFIKNIIEWKKPDWAKNLPLSGTEESRVLQKVCCEAVSTKENPRFVDLKLIGLDLFGFGGTGTTEVVKDKGEETKKGLGGSAPDGPAAYLEENPVELRGPLKAPFGRFEILYLDEEMRVIKTMQGFLAVNTRDKVDWF